MTTPRTILIVDDSSVSLTVSKEALEAAGFNVVTANTLAELEGVREREPEPDLILMDVQMPEAFGDDVGMVLRDARGVTAPIYLWSTLPTDELDKLAKGASLTGYISKMDGVETMVERVQQHFGTGN